VKIVLSTAGLLTAAVLAACAVSSGDQGTYFAGRQWGLQYRATNQSWSSIDSVCHLGAKQVAAGLNEQDEKDWIQGCTSALNEVRSTTATATTTDTPTTTTDTPTTTDVPTTTTDTPTTETTTDNRNNGNNSSGDNGGSSNSNSSGDNGGSSNSGGGISSGGSGSSGSSRGDN
jgi:uncharacterized membrane protein YgcG